MVKARAARREELADRGVVAQRAQQLDVALADLEQHGLDALLLDGLAMLLGHAEALPVQVDRSVEVCDGHSDVVDPFEHGASFKQPPHPRNVPRLPL